MSDATTRLTQWAIDKITSEYVDDVALLVAVDGASCDGDEHGQPFDYFVPATERGNEFAQTFIIGDVGNDLYPRSWERTERTACLKDSATQCLAKARILYSRSDMDTARFEALRQSLFMNLANPEFTYRKALENLDTAMDLYKTVMFEDRLYRARGLAGFIYRYLATAVACLNGTYFDDGTDAQWQAMPERFTDDYQAILQAVSVAALRDATHSMIASVRRFIMSRKPEIAVTDSQPDFDDLADWYQELKTTWRRILYYCSVGDPGAAFNDAVYLQNELDIVSEEFGLGEMVLLGCFDATDLGLLASRATELEDVITSAIDQHGVVIRRYDSIDDFLAGHLSQNGGLGV